MPVRQREEECCPSIYFSCYPVSCHCFTLAQLGKASNQETPENMAVCNKTKRKGGNAFEYKQANDHYTSSHLLTNTHTLSLSSLLSLSLSSLLVVSVSFRFTEISVSIFLNLVPPFFLLSKKDFFFITTVFRVE